MELKYRLCAMVLCLAASGCSNNQLLVKKQTEMEARLEQLLQANSGSAARLAEMSNELTGLQGQIKVNSADLDQLKSGMQELKAGMELSSQHAEGKTPAPVPPRIVVVNKEVSSGQGQSLEQDSYMKAFGLFSTNNYIGAI
ncbi:MAG: tol-pal system protein YbgF, partial [Geobacter sp.]